MWSAIDESEEILVPEGVYYYELRSSDLFTILSRVKTMDLILFYLGMFHPNPVKVENISEFLLFVKQYKNKEIATSNACRRLNILRSNGYAAKVDFGWYRISKKGLIRLKWLHYVERKLPLVPACKEVTLKIRKVQEDGTYVEIRV